MDQIGLLPKWYLDGAIDAATSGVASYALDVNLSKEQENLYAIGRVIRVEGYVEAAARFCEMRTSHRFVILSNHMYDVSELASERMRPWLTHTTRRRPRFKVVDIMREGGKTQIVLLHLLDDERWELWRDPSMGADALVVSSARSLFEECVSGSGSFSVEASVQMGQDNSGNLIGFSCGLDLISIEEPVTARLVPVGERCFRELSERIVYIQGIKEKIRLDASEWDEVYPDSLAYCYIHPEHGLSFSLLCSAQAREDGKVQTRDDMRHLYVSVEARSIMENGCAAVLDSALYEYEDRIAFLREEFADYDERMGRVRALRGFDEFRSIEYPDIVLATLVESSCQEGEQVRCQLDAIREDGAVVATLLNSPCRVLSAREGDPVLISLLEYQGNLHCIAERV